MGVLVGGISANVFLAFPKHIQLMPNLKKKLIESKPTLNDMLDEMRKSPIFCKYQEVEEWRDHDSSKCATKNGGHNNPSERQISHSYHAAHMDRQFKNVAPRYKTGFNNGVMEKARKDEDERLVKSYLVCSCFLFNLLPSVFSFTLSYEGVSLLV